MQMLVTINNKPKDAFNSFCLDDKFPHQHQHRDVYWPYIYSWSIQKNLHSCPCDSPSGCTFSSVACKLCNALQSLHADSEVLVGICLLFFLRKQPTRAVNICPHKQYFAQGIGLIYCSHAVTLHSSAWSQTLETSGLSEGIRGLPSCRLWHACHTNPLPGPLLSVTLLTSDPLKQSCSPDCNPILRFTPQNTQT